MKYRLVDKSDEVILTRFIAADKFHLDQYPVSFWIHPECFTLEDEEGIILYLRPVHESVTRVRMYIQFPPEDEVIKSRVAKAVLDIIMNVLPACKKSGVEEVVFGSVSPSLVKFCVKHGGFTHESGNDYVRKL